jgi:hypothetical protein
LEQKNDNLQKELYSYMNRFSELQIHKENNESDLKKQINLDQDKIKSYLNTINERENQIHELKKKVNEMNEEFQNMLQAELNNIKFVDKKSYESNFKANEELILQLNDQISSLKNELNTATKNYNSEVAKTEMNELNQKLIDSKNEEIDDLQHKIQDLEKQQNIKVEILESTIRELKEKEIKDLIIYRDLIETKLKDSQELTNDYYTKLSLTVEY